MSLSSWIFDILEKFHRRFLSSKIIGAFEKRQNDFRKMNLPLNFLKWKLFLEKKTCRLFLYPAAFGRHLIQLVHFWFSGETTKEFRRENERLQNKSFRVYHFLEINCFGKLEDEYFFLNFGRGQNQTRQKIRNLSTIVFEKYYCNEFVQLNNGYSWEVSQKIFE